MLPLAFAVPLAILPIATLLGMLRLMALQSGSAL
jgi:hypothetical protein